MASPRTYLAVQQQWIDEHTPGILELITEPLVLSACGRFATRTLRAQIDVCDEQQCAEVKYDLPPASGESAEQKKLRGNKHRMREEEALRALDVVAAAEHRAKRAKHMHDQRQQEDEVAGVLERVLAAVCRYADLEERRGPARCPGGCERSDPTCARAAFRLTCVF